LVAAFGRGTIEIDEDDALHETGYLALNCAKAREQLDWQPVLGVEETIRWSADWYGALLRDPASIAEVTWQQIHRYEWLRGTTSRERRKVA
jgi:CDP-glucose 4,6-dehydratase